MEKASWIVPAMVLLVLLVMLCGGNTEVDCSLSELRCELMCQLTELTRQCAKCRWGTWIEACNYYCENIEMDAKKKKTCLIVVMQDQTCAGTSFKQSTCRSRAPVRFGKRSGHQHHHYPPLLPPPPPLPLDSEGQPVMPYEEKLKICCGQLLEFLLKTAAVAQRK